MSSIMVFCRAMVMLACLLAIPLAALFYGDLPEGFRRAVSRGRSFLADRLADDVGVSESAPPLPSISIEASPSKLERLPDVARPAAAEPVEFSRESPPSTVVEPEPWSPPPTSDTAWSGESVAVKQARFEEQATPKLPPFDSAADVAEQLQTLGAVDYMLERWGNDSLLYRFHCKMPIAGSTHVCRHFEAFDASPTVAVAEVVLAVKAWQQQRQ